MPSYPSTASKWEEIEGKPSFEPIWETILDLNVDIAELNYANSLNADNRDQLFVDPFIDESKINSKTKTEITTGQNGKAELAPQSANTESFNPGSGSANTGTVSYDVDVNARGYFDEIAVRAEEDFTASPTASFTASDYSRLIDNETVTIIVSLNSGTINFDVEDSSGNVLASDSNSSGWINFDRTSTSYSGTLFSISTQTVQVNDGYGSLSFTEVEYQDGSLTSTVFDKGYIPTAIQLDADKATDSETSVSARVFDGNGNEINISEDKFGEQINASFSDQTIQAELQLSTSNPAKTPTANDYGLRVVK